MDQLVKAFISRSALQFNVRLLQKKAGAPLCAMVKADAYGHGTAPVVKALKEMKIAFWGVATINEAIELRELSVREPILVTRPLTPYAPEKTMTDQIRLMRRLKIRPTLAGADILKLLAGALKNKSGPPLHVHLKVDTGMGRNGCLPAETADLLAGAERIQGLKIEGIYSHFACATDKNPACARKQLGVFNSVLAGIRRLKFDIPVRHMANSGAIFAFPEARFDLVRPGKALYGYSAKNSKASRRLRPAMRVEAPLVFIKWIVKGGACGYGCTFKAKRKTRIGLLPIGYADGYARELSNRGVVGFNGKFAPVIGRISMDLTIVDLTDLPEASVGSAICVISDRRADPNSVESIAALRGTLPHEVGCNLGNRVQRVPAG